MKKIHFYFCFVLLFYISACSDSSDNHPEDDLDEPYGNMLINNGEYFTETLSVVLNINIIDAVSMRFSNDNVNWSDWQDYAGEIDWELEFGHSGRTVYGQFRHENNNLFIADDTITPLLEETLIASHLWPCSSETGIHRQDAQPYRVYC